MAEEWKGSKMCHLLIGHKNIFCAGKVTFCCHLSEGQAARQVLLQLIEIDN